MTIFGDLIVERLIEILTKDCLVPAIPYEHKESKIYSNLVSLCTSLCDYLTVNIYLFK